MNNMLDIKEREAYKAPDIVPATLNNEENLLMKAIVLPFGTEGQTCNHSSTLRRCQGTSAAVHRELKKQGINSIVIQINTHSPVTGTGKIWHEVAIATIDGNIYVIDHPQNELFGSRHVKKGGWFHVDDPMSNSFHPDFTPFKELTLAWGMSLSVLWEGCDEGSDHPPFEPLVTNIRHATDEEHYSVDFPTIIGTYKNYEVRIDTNCESISARVIDGDEVYYKTSDFVARMILISEIKKVYGFANTKEIKKAIKKLFSL